jgi:hypothetical protein
MPGTLDVGTTRMQSILRAKSADRLGGGQVCRSAAENMCTCLQQLRGRRAGLGRAAVVGAKGRVQGRVVHRLCAVLGRACARTFSKGC